MPPEEAAGVELDEDAVPNKLPENTGEGPNMPPEAAGAELNRPLAPEATLSTPPELVVASILFAEVAVSLWPDSLTLPVVSSVWHVSAGAVSVGNRLLASPAAGACSGPPA